MTYLRSEAYNSALEVFNAEITKAKIEAGPKRLRTAGRPTKAMPHGEDEQWWRANGPNMIHAWGAWREANPNLDVWVTPNGQPGIELEFNVQVGAGVVMKGFADRVMQDKNTGDLLILDVKSGKNAPKSPLQLAFYRVGMEETFGESPRFGAYWMGRAGTLDNIHNLDRFPPVMVKRWLRDVRKAMELGLFVPNTSSWCSGCGVNEFCYAYNPAAPRPDFESDVRDTIVEEVIEIG